MIALATAIRSLLVLAVFAATGPWCCCWVLPHETTGQTERRACCTEETTPAHAPLDQNPCEGGCDVIVSTPDAPGYAAVLLTQDDNGQSLIALTAGGIAPISIAPAVAVNLTEPPGALLPALRSLYAQRCQLLI